MVQEQDVVMILSKSGESPEVKVLLSLIRGFGNSLISIVGNMQSVLARQSNIVLNTHVSQEACMNNLAPTSSTTTQLVMGDALAIALMELRGFGSEEFARFHPGGSLGRKLAKVEEVMRPLVDCRVAQESQTLRSALVNQSRPGRRTGAIMIVSKAGVLTGIFTDSDLARLLESRREASIDQPISQVMTKNPKSVRAGTLLPAACEILAEKKISELPVVDAAGHPLGLVDITDIVATSGPRETRKFAASGPTVLKLVKAPRRQPKR